MCSEEMPKNKLEFVLQRRSGIGICSVCDMHSTLWAWGTVILKMVPHGAHTCSAYSTPTVDPADDREERILAILGIIGTVLNLLVVIFVYIYTTI
ncbi:hypothetical protein AALO_G00204070 [Alosa alosa]|uniref:Uncharacterized protein n=1 Tax=Alosa alosa TaxID=278164 RepID=A0AAV6G3B2_9TELE|nr:hypothetical protein AALO_G00204070 [Alosa alosa]